VYHLHSNFLLLPLFLILPHCASYCLKLFKQLPTDWHILSFTFFIFLHFSLEYFLVVILIWRYIFGPLFLAWIADQIQLRFFISSRKFPIFYSAQILLSRKLHPSWKFRKFPNFRNFRIFRSFQSSSLENFDVVFSTCIF